MKPTHSPEDRLLANLLLHNEAIDRALPMREHPDEETLSLFTEGLLPDYDRPAVIEHLASCSSCRQLIALLWEQDQSVDSRTTESENVDEVRTIRLPENFSRVNRLWTMALAVAAGLLLVVGIQWQGGMSSQIAEGKTYASAKQLLSSADFEKAEQLLNEADRKGIRSDRLRSLSSQAVRRLPGSLALASSGLLTEFGFGIGGTIGRGSESKQGLREAELLLGDAPSEQLEVLLNRGHLKMSKNDFDAAAVDFARASEVDPQEPLALLGIGLADFARQDFAAAEVAFENCLRLSPNHLPARVNRAMTLEELDRFDEARAEWQRVLRGETPDELQAQIEQHLKTLE
ncbi:MAG: tetratricopeptide repeat protein [Pirellulaceae bacterium]|nr:tetratricopeptide repeat protein [Pirellulaceae bacterium]